MEIMWFVVGFCAFVVCVLIADLVAPPTTNERPYAIPEPKPAHSLEEAERAVYNARTEEEYDKAIEHLLSISHDTLDD